MTIKDPAALKYEMGVPAHKRDGVKWNTLQQRAELASEAAKPSADAAYWAKRNCTVCYGRGVVGTITMKVQTNMLVNSQLCLCAKRNFVKWRDEFCRKWLEQHANDVVAEEAK